MDFVSIFLSPGFFSVLTETGMWAIILPAVLLYSGIESYSEIKHLSFSKEINSEPNTIDYTTDLNKPNLNRPNNLNNLNKKRRLDGSFEPVFEL